MMTTNKAGGVRILRAVNILLVISLLLTIFLYSISSLLRDIDIRDKVPTFLYPANIVAVFRSLILLASVRLAAARGGGLVRKWSRWKRKKQEPLSVDSKAESRHMTVWCGPLLSLCWIVMAILDLIDGPMARQSDTTSDLGEWLDHAVLDPTGAWLALLAARSALPSWDWLWLVSALRSMWPVSQLLPHHGVPLTYGPVAWVLMVTGLSPLLRLVVRRLGCRIWSAEVRTVTWYGWLGYLTLLLLSYPINYEDSVRWDKMLKTLIFA